VKPNDVLTATGFPVGTIVAGAYNAGTGQLVLTSPLADATLAEWQTALRQVTFSNSGPAPDSTNRDITVIVDDDVTATGTSNITHTTITLNAPPTLDSIANVTVNEDGGVHVVSMTGISAGPGETDTFTITATSNNTAAIPNPNVHYTQGQSTGSLTFSPVTNANGNAVITVTVTDTGSGTNNVQRTFTVTINPLPDAPSIRLHLQMRMCRVWVGWW